MPALFDGVTSLLNDVFGDPVTHISGNGIETTVQSVFRKTPVKVADADGREILLLSPWWRVSQDALPTRPRRLDQILAPDGKRYRIESVWEGGADAADAHLVCELEAIE